MEKRSGEFKLLFFSSDINFNLSLSFLIIQKFLRIYYLTLIIYFFFDKSNFIA